MTVAEGTFAAGHLGELTRLLPFEMVDEALAETRKVQSRVRDLPSRVEVYLLLAGCLFPASGCPQVWRRLVAGLHGITVASPTAGALGQAPRRVGAAPLRWLFDLLRGPAAGIATPGTRWHGLLVCAIDGTTMTVADSDANLTAFTKPGGHNGGSSHPLLRLLVLLSCGTRTVLDAVFGPVTSGETTYAARLTGAMREGTIVLADRNFAAASLIAAIADTGAHVLSGSRPAGNCRRCAATTTGPTCRCWARSRSASWTPRSPSQPEAAPAPVPTGWSPPCSTTTATPPPD